MIKENIIDGEMQLIFLKRWGAVKKLRHVSETK
jgi:hypothetical protein